MIEKKTPIQILVESASGVVLWLLEDDIWVASDVLSEKVRNALPADASELALVMVSGNWTLADACQIAKIACCLSRMPEDVSTIVCCSSKAFASQETSGEEAAARLIEALSRLGSSIIYNGLSFPANPLAPLMEKGELRRRGDRPAPEIHLAGGSKLHPHMFCYHGPLPEDVSQALLAKKLSHLYGKHGKGEWLSRLFPDLGWPWYSTTMSDAARPIFAARFLAGVCDIPKLPDLLFPLPPDEYAKLGRLIDSLPCTLPDSSCPRSYLDVVDALAQAKAFRHIIVRTMMDWGIQFRENTQHSSFDEKIEMTRCLLSALGCDAALEACRSGVPARDVLA